MPAFNEIMSSTGQAGLSSATSGIGSGLAGALFGGIQARRQWKYQQKSMALQQEYALAQMAKSAEYQLQHDKAMFDYQNDYNDPSKVLDRYLRAGVNPSAVLGSSGVGVSATVPTGSGGSPSGGAPSGSGGSIGGNVSIASDPTAIAQNMLTATASRRNDAAARLDNAEAENLERRTQSRDYYATLADLDRQLLSHNVSDAKAMATYHEALAVIEKARSSYSDLSATYHFEELIANVGLVTEEYYRLKSLNDAEIPLFSEIVAADLTLTLAQADAARAGASLARSNTAVADLTAKDLEEWYRVNWDTAVDVPQVDEHGKPTGKTIKMTGREIKEYLLGLSHTAGKQGVNSNWYSIRSQKNALGYQIANTVVKAAAYGTAGYVSKGASMPATYGEDGSEHTVREHYDSDGTRIGGTAVERSWTKRRSRR
nr:MAG: DNA pilot protein [Microvirus sp.]